MKNIPLFKVHSPPGIGKVLQEVWDSGFITEGEYSDKFEKEFGSYIQNDNVSLTNSCTSALCLAAYMCDIRPGDEVITTAMTCMATNQPFSNAGANLVFADVEKDTGNIDIDSIKTKITNRTKAIIMVHWAGQPGKIDEINNLAKAYGIKTIEDAAHSLGASYKGDPIGSGSDYVCFSFQAIKHLTTADGGAIACRSKDDLERIKKLRWFGLDRKYQGPSRWEQDIPESGFKFHMNNVNAAIGLEQLKYIDTLIGKHINNGVSYDEKLDNKNIEKLKRVSCAESSYWIYSLLVSNRDKFKEYLSQHGISSDVVHVRNDRYSCFSQFSCEMPNLDYFESRLINIPVGWWLSEEDHSRIVDCVNKY